MLTCRVDAVLPVQISTSWQRISGPGPVGVAHERTVHGALSGATAIGGTR